MIEYVVKEWADGHKEWYLNGKLHREDGPAIEWSDGSKSWWLNGKLHREDGTAIERSDGSKFWWLNGKQVTQEEVEGTKTCKHCTYCPFYERKGKGENRKG